MVPSRRSTNSIELSSTSGRTPAALGESSQKAHTAAAIMHSKMNPVARNTPPIAKSHAGNGNEIQKNRPLMLRPSGEFFAQIVLAPCKSN